jgi:outer membrane protein TolC
VIDIKDAIADVEKELLRAQEQRRKIRKKVSAGVSHDSHLEFADGLVAGLEAAILIMQDKCKSETPKGEING